MLWPNPSQRRSVSMEVDGQEIQVHIDEPLTVDPNFKRARVLETNNRTRLGSWSRGVGSSRLNVKTVQGDNDTSSSSPHEGDPTPFFPALNRGVSQASSSSDLPNVLRVSKQPRTRLRDLVRVNSASSVDSARYYRSLSVELSDDDDDDDDDDENDRMMDREDRFERAVVKVTPKGGILTLEYKKETSQQQSPIVPSDERVDSSSSVSKDEVISASSSESDCEDEPNNIDARNIDSEGYRFKLISTNIHSEEDKQRRARETIRTAVLEAAAEAYKTNRLEVPDELLAEINQIRCDRQLDQFDPTSNADLSSSETPKQSNLRSTKLATSTKCVKSKNQSSKESTSSNEKNNIFVKKLKLTDKDEIHVIPCQCALTLVGMRSLDFCAPLISPPSSADIGKERANSASQSSSFETSKGGSRRVQFRALGNAKHKSNMVRTASAKAAEDDKKQETTAQTSKQPIPADPGLQLGGPPTPLAAQVAAQNDAAPAGNHDKTKSSSLLPLRSCSSCPDTFTLLGYHEVVLLRSSSIAQDGAEFTQWEGLSLRCKDHDEMDILIRALRDSTGARVVPFSPNPREKLKNKRKILAKSQNVWRKKLEFSKEEPSAPEQHVQKPSGNSSSQVLARVAPSSDEVSESPVAINYRENESKGWNKKNHCELCRLHFTLLTRRHHCRKCDRSCCGDCSSTMVVHGGSEVRYCNPCSARILWKQSSSLRNRSARRASNSVLPGKVHKDCRKMGVAVLGKLPHWKNFFSWDEERRPAVGRLSVELIEAIALPSVDVNGKADPYVRATVTGYDRDLRWTLQEWLPDKRFSLSSVYCASTLSPVWRGPGLKGGDLLTLPVISTAGAVLRLEVLHYDVMTSSKGKDKVLAVVEIPLSDLPNANLRKVRSESDEKSKRMLSYDGYCDRWYRLQSPNENTVMAKPIENPQLLGSDTELHEGSESTAAGVDGGKGPGVQSLHEIGKRLQGFAIAPIDWFGSVLDLDFSLRRPNTVCPQHKSRSSIHVRIKLNASETGDLLSHAWFPPIHPWPQVRKFDPQFFWSRITKVHKHLEPYLKVVKFIEAALKWHHPPEICTLSYMGLAFHMFFIQHLLVLLHLYLFVFLVFQLAKAGKSKKRSPSDVQGVGTIERTDSFLSTSPIPMEKSSILDGDGSVSGDALPMTPNTVNESVSAFGSKTGLEFVASPSLAELNQFHASQTLRSIGSANTPISRQETIDEDDSVEEEEETESRRLHKAVYWIAKKLGDNIGLESMQFKISMFGRDIAMFNSFWDGSYPLRTRFALAVVCLSFIFHLYFSARFLWITGTASVYFGVSPLAKRLGRAFAGSGRGLAKIVRRRHLHHVEVSKHLRKKS